MSHKGAKVTWHPDTPREHLASTKATIATCHRCGTPTLTALDTGITARVDAQPLDTPHAEIAALLEGRETFTRTPGGQLIRRTAERIHSGWLKGTIHAAHKCTRNEQEALF